MTASKPFGPSMVAAGALLAVAFFFSLMTSPALAHRQPEVVGTVVYDTENGEPVTKVTWRFHAHDALTALGQIPEVERLNLEEERNLIEIAGYVASWVDYDGGVQPTTLGAEVEANYVFVYQLLPGHVRVAKAAILSDVAPGWNNLVNYHEGRKTLPSITFTAEYPEGTAAR